MRSFALIASLVIYLGFTCPVPVAALDSFEPNDIPDNAYALPNGDQIESWISDASDTDWFYFLTMRLGDLSIALESLPYNYDLDLWWYDPQEDELVLIGRSDNGGTSDEYIGGTLLVAGLFFVNVYGIDSAYDAQDSYLLQAAWPTDSPVVEVTSPNGGESYATASSQTILFTASDADTPDSTLAIKLEYSADSGATWALIDSAQANTGSYLWTVPYLSTTEARVRVTAHDGFSIGYSTSAQDFSIYGVTHSIAADGSGDYPTIQQAVDGANGGDIVELADGTYSGFRNRDIDFGGKWLTVQSESGDSTACIIDCNGSFSDPHRGFYFHSGEGSWAVVSGLSIIDGYAESGADYGGGIYCTNGSTPTITSCRLVNNHANRGGGLYSDVGGMTITGCEFSGNSAREGGGAYFLETSAALASCLFLDNTAELSGGAIYCRSSSPSVSRCLFAGNEADFNGGAILCWIDSSPSLTSCTFSANNATFSGSGLSCWHTSLPQLDLTIITGAANGQAVHCDATSDATLTCCDVYGNTDGDWTGCLADQANQDGNISADPMFCNAAEGDWRISSYSMCAPDNNPVCGLIGVYGVGCGVTGDENVFCEPDTLALTTGAPTASQALNYTGGGSGAVAGYEIDAQWDHTVISVVFTKPLAGPFANAAFFQATATGDGQAKVIATLAGGATGSTGPDDLFLMEWTAIASEDTSSVDITLIEFRDGDNNTLTGFSEVDGAVTVSVGPQISNVLITNDTISSTDYIKHGDAATVTATIEGIGDLLIKADLSNLGGGSEAVPDSYSVATSIAIWEIGSVTTTPDDGDLDVIVEAWDEAMKPAIPQADTIVADNTKPVDLEGLIALPGHERVALSWDDPSGNDLHYGGVMIRREAWGDYPTYSTDPPAYPVNESAGSLAYDGVGVSAVDSFAVPSRDIYYYRGFVFDLAGNYSASGDSARSTNYWLGDVVPNGDWNGLVTTADISVLGSQFLLDPLTNDQADIAPTHNSSRLGLPEPDGAVDLEDAMIFSLNFGVVSRRGPATPIESAESEVTLSLNIELADYQDAVIGESVSAIVWLDDSSGLVKGAQLRVDYDPTVMELLNVAAGALPAESDALVMTKRETFSAVALGEGTTLGGSGEMAIYRFRRIGPGEAGFCLADLLLRDEWNRDVLPSLCDVDEDSARLFPTSIYLSPNHPNPFRKSTNIAFGLPTASKVNVQIFDITGRLIEELLQDTLPPGEYTISWDRRDLYDHLLPNGIYLCRLTAAGKVKSRKMVVR